MKIEFIIGIELNNDIERALNNIRWNHIDIEKLLTEELSDQIEEMIMLYGRLSNG